jgi:hypothetical protein
MQAHLVGSVSQTQEEAQVQFLQATSTDPGWLLNRTCGNQSKMQWCLQHAGTLSPITLQSYRSIAKNKTGNKKIL